MLALTGFLIPRGYYYFLRLIKVLWLHILRRTLSSGRRWAGAVDETGLAVSWETADAG